MSDVDTGQDAKERVVADRSTSHRTSTDAVAGWPDLHRLYDAAGSAAPEPSVWDVMRALHDVRSEALALSTAV